MFNVQFWLVFYDTHDIRYMKPNTVHYVLTVDDAITYSHHFYPAHCAQMTTFGIIHVFILNFAVTNTLHDELFTLIRRIMAMWHVRYDEDRAFNAAADPHIPNISTVSGLMDIMAFGNLLELAQVLDRRRYQNEVEVHWLEAPEMGIGRWRYRKLQTYFAKRYVTEVGGKIICPTSIFRRSLVEFAAAVVLYKKKRAYKAPKGYGGTPAQVQQKMFLLFQENYPELLGCLKRMIAKGDTQCLYWTGPSITIRRRTKHDCYPANGHPNQVQQQLDFDNVQIFSPDGLEGDEKGDENQKEKHDNDKGDNDDGHDESQDEEADDEDEEEANGDDSDDEVRDDGEDEDDEGEDAIDKDEIENNGEGKDQGGKDDEEDDSGEDEKPVEEEQDDNTGDQQGEPMVVDPGMKENQDSDVVMKSVDGDPIPSGDAPQENRRKKGKGKAKKKGKGKAVETPSTPAIRPMTRSQQAQAGWSETAPASSKGKKALAEEAPLKKTSAAVAEGSTSTPKRNRKRSLPVDTEEKRKAGKKQKRK